MLCLQAKSGSEIIFLLPLDGVFTLHKIAAVKLQARLIGIYIHYDGRPVANDTGGMPQTCASVFIQYKIVVIAMAIR